MPIVRTAVRELVADADRPERAVANPCRSRKLFSAIRSCAMATAAAGGRTRTHADSRSSASAGTFSNSVVTAAQSRASSSSAAVGRS